MTFSGNDSLNASKNVLYAVFGQSMFIIRVKSIASIASSLRQKLSTLASLKDIYFILLVFDFFKFALKEGQSNMYCAQLHLC